jgi:NAD(P)-dependent dehydrogenase (short-subunit alcohol dehydrogenase family)
MMRRFEDWRVVVAGCGYAVEAPDDLGAASAKLFAAEGAHVLVIQPTLAAADIIVEEILAAGGNAQALAADPRNTDEMMRVTERVAEIWDSLDVLVTHYLDIHVQGIEATTLEQWDETLRVNLTSVFLAAKGLVPLLRKSDRASIVNIGSIDGTFANPNLIAYTASKGGVNSFTHALAGELASSGIRVNCAAQTASTLMPLNDAAFDTINRATPLARAGTPEEYAAVALFLASREASYLTGVILPVDGGRSAVTAGTAPGYAGYEPKATSVVTA